MRYICQIGFEIAQLLQGVKVNYSPDFPRGLVPIGSVVPIQFSEDRLNASIDAYNIKHGTSLKLSRGYMLQLSTVIPTLFEPLITSITDHLTNLLAKPALKHVKYLLQ